MRRKSSLFIFLFFLTLGLMTTIGSPLTSRLISPSQNQQQTPYLQTVGVNFSRTILLPIFHSNIAEGFASVTVLFADLVGFTKLASRKSPRELVRLQDEIFSRFDELAEKHGLEKIKTIGDAYMVVGGLPMPLENHAQAIACMAL